MTTFQFFRAGGFDQVRFDSGRDLASVDALDQKLWVALACPTKGLGLDPRTLELIDTDKDGRIRAPELIAAIKWAMALVKDPDDLLRGEGSLPLSAINTDNPDGARLHAAAKAVLQGLGRADATTLTIPESANAAKSFDAMPLNGDGVLTPDCADGEQAKKLIADILATVGGVADRSGKPGVSQETVSAFFTEVRAYLEWLAVNDDAVSAAKLSGDAGAAFTALQAVRSKIDDYFARCRVAAFDPRSTAALNGEQKDYAPLAAGEVRMDHADLRALPLARVEARRALPIGADTNPAWTEEIERFATLVVTPVLGARASLTESDWHTLHDRFRPWEEAQATKKGAVVEVLGGVRLKEIAAAPGLLDPSFAADLAKAPVAAAITSLERLALYRRDLFRLANNFINFRDFYERKTRAIFQCGTLYLDQRACDLCIRVDDMAKHATMAPLSRACLAYCDCTRASTGEKMTIVAAFTAGDSDNLLVGRNGIFYDHEGRDWDATIIKLIDNPISVRQAFASPYKKALRFIEEQIAKRAAEEDKGSQALITSSVDHAGSAATTGKAPPAPKKLDIGIVAALGVAVGGITAALSGILQAFFGLGFWMPFGFVALLLAISGPSMLIAWLKLRQRNIGPLLDANGWAVNANARVNIPFGGSLTARATLPKGAKLDTRDPYREARRRWWLYIAALIAASLTTAWALGKLEHLLPERLQHDKIFAPAGPASAPAAPGR